MRRKRALTPRNNLEARLWVRLRELKEQGWHFRRAAPFKTFTLDFVAHDARLVIDLLDGEPGERNPPTRITRDRLLSQAGYVILRLSREEAGRDLDAAIRRIRAVLEDQSADSD